MVRKTYKYRLFTNTNQERELAIVLETHRRLYNTALDGKRLCWEPQGVNWSYYEQSAWFKIQRRINPYYARLNYWSAQNTLRTLDKAFKGFFARVNRGSKPGYPRFKSADRFNSFTFDMGAKGGGCKIVDRKLRLQNIGTIRVRWHRDIPDAAIIKQATITRRAGKWYVCFSLEIPNIKPESIPPESIGIDLGLTNFVVTSNGETLGHSRTLERNLGELRRRQRALSRCQRGSFQRAKVKQRVVKLYAKVADTRRDMHHKVAYDLVSRYGFIAAENLNIQGMLKNRRLSRRISDAAWAQFIGILTAKAECAGRQVKLVDPKYTSQECSQCGSIVRKSLAVRVHRCDCGCVLDRDHNAAKNILARAGPEFVNMEAIPC